MPDKGNFFKERREQLGLTQRDIANIVGVTDGAVSSWENAEAAPRLKLKLKLSVAYEVSESRILKEIDELSSTVNAAKEAASTK